MKLTGDLIIEVTRKCNLVCDHCLRGAAQNKEISFIAMCEVVDQFEYINNVTFTGGEPSLNPSAIQHFLTLCRSRSIGVGSFYIATNAVTASGEFLEALLDLWLYCDDMEDLDNSMGGVAISNDYFHETDQDTIKRLMAFRFTEMRYTKDRQDFYDSSYLINEGFQFDNYNEGRENTPESLDNLDFEEFKESGYFSEITLYLNCDNQIILGCDWSYENQEEHVLCKSSDSIYDALIAAYVPA